MLHSLLEPLLDRSPLWNTEIIQSEAGKGLRSAGKSRRKKAKENERTTKKKTVVRAQKETKTMFPFMPGLPAEPPPPPPLQGCESRRESGPAVRGAHRVTRLLMIDDANKQRSAQSIETRTLGCRRGRRTRVRPVRPRRRSAPPRSLRWSQRKWSQSCARPDCHRVSGTT
jgi:hypothetical protein